MQATQTETWRPIVGRQDRYEVSSEGRVRSPAGQVVSVGTPTPYLRVTIGGARRYVHHLVAESFLGPRPDGTEIRHLNGDHSDNRAANLRYGTRSANVRDAVNHGTHVQARKTHCPQGHPYNAANTRMYDGRRYCKGCYR